MKEEEEENFYIKGFGDKQVRPMLRGLGYQLMTSALIATMDFPYLCVDPRRKKVCGVTAERLDRKKVIYNSWEDYASKNLPTYEIDLKIEKESVPIQVTLEVFSTVFSAKPLYDLVSTEFKSYLNKAVYQFVVKISKSLEVTERISSEKVLLQMSNKTYKKINAISPRLNKGIEYETGAYKVNVLIDDSTGNDFIKLLAHKEVSL